MKKIRILIILLSIIFINNLFATGNIFLPYTYLDAIKYISGKPLLNPSKHLVYITAQEKMYLYPRLKIPEELYNKVVTLKIYIYIKNLHQGFWVSDALVKPQDNQVYITFANIVDPFDTRPFIGYDVEIWYGFMTEDNTVYYNAYEVKFVKNAKNYCDTSVVEVNYCLPYCSIKNLDLCMTEQECTDAGGYWDNGLCSSDNTENNTANIKYDSNYTQDDCAKYTTKTECSADANCIAVLDFYGNFDSCILNCSQFLTEDNCNNAYNGQCTWEKIGITDYFVGYKCVAN